MQATKKKEHSHVDCQVRVAIVGILLTLCRIPTLSTLTWPDTERKSMTYTLVFGKKPTR
jgi:hypothetical protein